MKEHVKKLDSIREKIIKHPSNAWARKKKCIPVYTAHPAAKIVLIGQAPGIRAQLSKTPWNDPSGDILRSWLNVTRDQFYNKKLFALVPMDFYFPGSAERGDLPPRLDFAPLWHEQILNQMPNVELFVLIGQYANKHYLGKNFKKNLTETTKNFQEYLPKFFPLFHPSPRNRLLFRKNPWLEKKTIPALRKEVRRILEKSL